MNTKKLIKNTFGAVLALTIIIFIVVLTAYGCSGIAYPLKEALTITIGFFGGFATLGAAFIAVHLFNDWRNIQRFELSKETLTALIKLKSHADQYYKKAEYHLKAYKLGEDQHISKDYVAISITNAKNCQPERDAYILKLDELLIIFFEKIDLYESVFKVELIAKEDRDHNFQEYVIAIKTMFSHAWRDETGQNSDLLLRHADNRKVHFNKTYYEELLTKLKYKALT